MSQILVRDLSPETVEKLKQRAKRNRRSLQQEVRLILEESSNAADREAEMLAERKRRMAEFRSLAADIARRSGPQTSDSTDLIREDRER